MAKVTEKECHICGKAGWIDYFLNHVGNSTAEWVDKTMMKVLKFGVKAPDPKDQAGIDKQLNEIRHAKGICRECCEKYIIPANFGLDEPYEDEDLFGEYIPAF